ncbi:hypothetical protein LTR08_006347 [Meristemomyces frigidus]|nr:hypothetical protein LTR08_006347 [Meristemomyces frigidus]
MYGYTWKKEEKMQSAEPVKMAQKTEAVKGADLEPLETVDLTDTDLDAKEEDSSRPDTTEDMGKVGLRNASLEVKKAEEGDVSNSQPDVVEAMETVDLEDAKVDVVSEPPESAEVLTVEDSELPEVLEEVDDMAPEQIKATEPGLGETMHDAEVETPTTLAEQEVNMPEKMAELEVDTLETLPIDSIATPTEDFAERLDSSPQPQTPGRAKSPSFHSINSEFHTPVSPVSPMTPTVEIEYSHRMSTRDSMASIALSESSLDYDHLSADQVEAALLTPRVRSRHSRRPSSLEILQNAWPPRPELERHSTLFDMSKDDPLHTPMSDRNDAEIEVVDYDMADDASLSTSSPNSVVQLPMRGSSLATLHSTSGSLFEQDMEVDWQQLDKNEEQEREVLPQGTEDESTAFLLARLEQENAKITAATEAAVSKKSVARIRSESRPPSMGHLKKLVQDRSMPSVRYSMALTDVRITEESTLEPPPMTELEYWAALVQDYPSTASRLPTLTTAKIRSGIPPPLRGVVWTSMAGARDRRLEEAFEKLQNEKSPYEGIINKDVGRSFPGVELFRDAEGEGQKMLGRVLNCFSLQDKDIGYCQGLGFLVGPLLMNMDERSAFCCLVRLMDTYNLRPSFLPSLSGLHMRIYQFSALLKQHHPQLSEHLTAMGVEPAYLSQWFLSCFAVTCPLPMLFRIYDVIFAEGANETVMRVALALMRRNEVQMMESTEFEEVMQLLLGRGIWDCYGLSADELVDDFTSLGGIITHARLAELEKEFESRSSDSVGEKAGFLPDVQAAAGRFLGRLWAPSQGGGHASSKSTSTLSPHTAEKDAGRTGSFLRRSPSKQSISTLNESSGDTNSHSSGSGSLVSTAPTDIDVHMGDEVGETMSFKSTKADSMRTVSVSTANYGSLGGHVSKGERDMHGQIEDLLTALSEMQREHAQLAAMLQREREERGEDHRAVKLLVGRLRKGDGGGDEEVVKVNMKEDRRRTMPPPARGGDLESEGVKQRPKSVYVESKAGQEKEELDGLLDKVNERLQSNSRFSASFETKAQLRDRLTRTRELLGASESSSRELTERLDVTETSLAAFTSEGEDLRAEVKELRVRVNEEFKARQKLEHTIRELKAEARAVERKDRERVLNSDAPPTLSRKDSLRRESTAPKFTFPAAAADADADAMGRRGSLSSSPVSSVAAPGLRELRLVRRESASSVLTLRTARMQKLEKENQPVVAVTPAPPTPQEAAPASPSPPTSAVVVETPTLPETPAPPPLTPAPQVKALPLTPSSTPALVVPAASPWHARTSSLATREVFATPQHSALPEEALLLELVNAKTAEAQARQEVDELKRSLAMSHRRHDVVLQQMRAEMEAAKAAAEIARLDVQAGADERVYAGSRHGSVVPSLSVPSTPGREDLGFGGLGPSEAAFMPVELIAGVRKADTAPAASAGGGGGWFWNRRSPSGVKGSGTPPAE